ncbi:SIS domain-containing protein [Pleomorphomonas sp. PLEO]|uniref:SIS domain-containing protein n=1 Tax=Pleomorphomonas sp. PLEO TaxID=3239306 RepID=UPI00351F0C13
MTEVVKNVESAVKAAAARAAVTDIFFVACGGSNALLMSGHYAVEREAEKIAGFSYTAAEFLARAPKRLGKNSIVILCSHSGNTPETVAAAKYSREAGALTISFTNVENSPLDQASEAVILYQYNPLAVSEDHAAPMLMRLVFGILAAREGNGKLAKVEKALAGMSKTIESVIAHHKSSIAAWAESYKREPVIYTMGSGANWGSAYSFAICILQEMQWVHSAAIHAGEYFHGPFEVADFDVPFIILKGLGNARKMDERALAFTEKYSKRLLVLDAAEFGLEAQAGDAAEYLTPMLFTALLRAYAVALADSRGHPLTVRRYMWRMEY